MGKMAIVVVLLLVVAAIVGYLTLGRSANINKTNDTSMPAEAETEGNNGQRSIRSILSMGENLECTFTDTDTGSNGTVYVGRENQMRGDFISVADDHTINGHTIVDGENIYFWTEGESQGFKASLSAAEDLANGANTGSFDINQEVDYECHNWTPDNSKFNLPTGVEFQDFSAMMEGLGEMMDNEDGNLMDESDQCAICDSLPQESQAQCKQALSC